MKDQDIWLLLWPLCRGHKHMHLHIYISIQYTRTHTHEFEQWTEKSCIIEGQASFYPKPTRCCSSYTNKATQVPGTRPEDTSLSHKANYYHPNIGRSFNTFGSFSDFLKFLRDLERDEAGELVKYREQTSGDRGLGGRRTCDGQPPSYSLIPVIWQNGLCGARSCPGLSSIT